ncbi:MAG: SPASM domain-containing protein [Saprospiraceae bacterium]|nr:SPASM domain-containing protein [Saprospiraceae bacterium]
MTLRRAWNAVRVLTSYYLTRLIGVPVQWGMPISISIEPTTACNLRCPECPSGLRAFSRPTGNVRADFFRRIVDELSRDTYSLYFYFQGEPYIHPEFFDMVRYAHERGLFTATSTNGHFLDAERARRTVESGLDRLIVSVDGLTQETYERYRVGGHLARVVQGIRELAYWKRRLRSRRPHVIVQFLVFRHNESQINAFRRSALGWGANEIRLKSAQVYDYQHGNPLIPEQERYARYVRQPNGTWAPRHALANRCWRLWHASVITWDGIVVPCCFDKDAQHRLGDLKTAPFRDIWHGAAYRQFRQRLLRGRKEIDICSNCSEGCRVWV